MGLWLGFEMCTALRKRVGVMVGCDGRCIHSKASTIFSFTADACMDTIHCRSAGTTSFCIMHILLCLSLAAGHMHLPSCQHVCTSASAGSSRNTRKFYAPDKANQNNCKNYMGTLSGRIDGPCLQP